MEYIRLTDAESHFDDGTPYEWYFEVDPQNERIGKRHIEVYASGRVVRVTEAEYLETAVELEPVPTAEELCSGVWGEHQHAERISAEQFEALWNAQPDCLPRLSEEAAL